MTIELLEYGIAIVVMWLVAMRLRSIRGRQLLYLAASYLFYATWGSWLIVILLFSTLMNYALGQWLKARITAGRLWTGVIFNLALLSVFKYLPLLGAAVPSASPLSLVKHIALPVGVSFWTFQAMSYLFDLYREEDLDPTLLEFGLYMAFWPTVLSGPICRMPSMLPQFRQTWSVSSDDLQTGVRRISVGVLMSVLAGVMSAGLSPGAGIDAAFARTTGAMNGIDVWCLIIGYGFQLYFNFCGYSHMVIGVARLFGIRLHENFNRPYLSTTPSIFWTRWHMSLSFWIRDYLFLPLATMRREVWWRNLSLVIAMFVFGVWHKGSVLFMIWGTYHGLLLVAHRQWQELRKRLDFEWTGTLATGISWALTFSAICIGYIFFRAESIPQAFAMVKAIVSPGRYAHLTLAHSFYVMNLLAGLGYFAVIGSSALLDRMGEAAGKQVSPNRWGTLLATVANERWVWIAPVVVVLALYLNLIFQPGPASTGPVMYGLF